MATVVIEIKQIKENQDEGVNILIKKLLAIFLNTHTKVIQLTPPTVRTLFLFLLQAFRRSVSRLYSATTTPNYLGSHKKHSPPPNKNESLY